ncbi:MAG TPA: DUF2777 family protein [Chondromyces sp.]|nr:DUF2777 family protein [Chondromyces sp.]
MKFWQRSRLLQQQPRSHTEGSIEFINEQWVFFDEENDEATNLEHFFEQEVEIFRHNQWIKGVLKEEAVILEDQKYILLKNNDTLKVKKQLILALELLMNDLSDDAFIQMLTTLNGLKFSLFDCIFCHNHLSFLEQASIRQGTNFILFDNGEMVCSVHHHFSYGEKKRDRFEFTLNTGKRLMIEKLT